MLLEYKAVTDEYDIGTQVIKVLCYFCKMVGFLHACHFVNENQSVVIK